VTWARSARWLLSLLLLLCLPLGAREPLRVSRGRQALLGHLEACLDPSRTFTFEAIQTQPFLELPGEASFGHDPGVLWLRGHLDWSAAGTGERWLELPSNLLDRVDLYRRSAEGPWDVQRSGRHIPFSQRTLATRKPTFRLPAIAGGTEVLFLRIETQGSIVLAPLLWEPSLQAVTQAREDWWEGLSGGMLLLLTGIHLSLGLTLRDRANTVYACYTGTALLSSLAYSGSFAFLLSPEFPRLDFWILAVALPALFALTWQIFSAIVSFGARFPRLDRALTWGTLALALALALGRLAGFNHTAGPILSVAFLLLMLGLFAAACWQVLAGNRSARFYLLAFTPLLLLLGIELARNLGVMQDDLLSSWILQVSGFGHVLALNIPVVLRLLQIKRERDASVARELATSQRNERHLETLVADRTTALGVAKERAELALLTAQEVLEGQRRLIRTVSHEFRTPLAVIDGTAQLLELQGEPGPPGQPSPATTIRAKVQKLLGFLDGALRQDQLESGHWRLTREILEPEPLLRTVLAGVDADPATHPVELQLERLPGTVFADPKMLTVLLSNLLENAIRYSPKGGGIIVSGQALAQGAVQIMVVDQGIGIPADQLPRVFDRFYRTGQLQGVDGSGLGLYLSREIARMHGGELSVESVLGQGSTFTLLLPAEDQL
jgi:signal transduction histidine kinase